MTYYHFVYYLERRGQGIFKFFMWRTLDELGSDKYIIIIIIILIIFLNIIFTTCIHL